MRLLKSFLLDWKWTPTTPLVLVLAAAVMCFTESGFQRSDAEFIELQGAPAQEALAARDRAQTYFESAVFLTGIGVGGAIFLAYGVHLGRRSNPRGAQQE